MTAATVHPPDRRREIRESQAASPSQRACLLLEKPVDFIPNPSFASEPFTQQPPGTAVADEGRDHGGDGLPSHLRRLCDTPLLSPAAEIGLFREMNLLKYQACQLLSELDPETASEFDIQAIEWRLERARGIRDYLISASTRLVMSIVKKFVNSRQTFDDLFSDGVCALMQAVEKFDYDRGFRFSTYAWRCIARCAYQTVATAKKEEARFVSDAEQWQLEPQDTAANSADDTAFSRLRSHTAEMLEKLDRRERFIIRSRYALGSHRRIRTFQFLADKLGVSKERVRQLEQRAVRKLQSMAAAINADETSVAVL